MTTIKSILAFLLFSLSMFSAKSQTIVCLGDDATVCAGSSVTIQDCNPGNTVGGVVLNNPTFVNLSDDSYSGVVPIGFNFDVNFFCATYSELRGAAGNGRAHLDCFYL